MAIPAFNEHGLLPDGIYECTLEEVEARFGMLQDSDRRSTLWAKFREFMEDATFCKLVKAVLVDGSFVTADRSQRHRSHPGCSGRPRLFR